MKDLRNNRIEKDLQRALDDGYNVWAIGDIHGHYQSFVSLVDRLELSENDKVVLLGDLIDRGPNSFGVIHTVRNNSNFVSVKGNHEAMMAENFSLEQLNNPDIDMMVWMNNGGTTTIRSYLDASKNNVGVLEGTTLEKYLQDDIEWIEDLPVHIVLDDWRLVHAGYDPELPLDEQTEEEYLWIRREFHQTQIPVDGKRTVVFGHTPTVSLPGHSEISWGHVWRSEVSLADGRPSAIGIDTCLYHGKHGMPAVLTAFNLQDERVIQQNRIEP